jgi:hypothetical protein
MNTNETEEILRETFKKMFGDHILNESRDFILDSRKEESSMRRFQERGCKKRVQNVRNYQIIIYNFSFIKALIIL